MSGREITMEEGTRLNDNEQQRDQDHAKQLELFERPCTVCGESRAVWAVHGEQVCEECARKAP